MLFFDDCFNFLKKIESNSIDLILTDPPYFISRSSNYTKYKDSIDFVKNKYANHSIDFGYWDTDIDIELLLSEYYRVLKKGGTLLMFYDIWKATLLKEIAINNKFKQPRVCQWLKSNPVPINSKNNYLSNSSEYFFTFVKGQKPTFNSYYDKGVYIYPLCHGKERLKHPTQKPLALINELICKHSNENDIVLDTFSGSGTTAISCIEKNRRFICIEKDETYYDMSLNRVNQNILIQR